MSEQLYTSVVETAALRRVGIASLFMVGIFIVGMLGYHILEGMSFFDGLYMTFITITTIGFNELQSLSTEGRIFTMIIFATGIGVVSYIASQMTQIVFENKLFLARAMNKKLMQLQEHYIICGYGRIGHRIAHVLRDSGLEVVVVENNEQRIERVAEDQFLYIKGDAQDEETLKKAGIDKANVLVCTLSSDKDNVFTTLLAREIRKDLFILVRANENSNRKRIFRAGADKVISPYDIGADRMANVILRPRVEQFIEKITRDDSQDHTFEEVLIADNSDLIGKTLADLNIPGTYEVLVIAIIPKDGRITFNPKSTDSISKGDSLVLLGDVYKINNFRTEACGDKRTAAERADQIEKIEHI